MFFGKSRKRKSDLVNSPEYSEYIETNNLQDALDLFERMKKHGFEPAGGMSRVRWSRGDDVFDFKKPFGPGVEAYDIPQAELDKLTALLDSLDGSEANEFTCDEFANGDKDLADYLRTVLGTGKHTVEDFESALEGYEEEPESTNLGTIAKSIASQDYGRNL